MPTVAARNAGRIALEIDGAKPVFASVLTLPAWAFPPDGAPTLGDFEASVNVSEARTLLDWVMSLPRRKAAESAGSVLVANLNLDLQRRIDWTHGVVTELSLGTLDARESKKPLALAFKWAASEVTYGKGGGKLATAVSKRQKGWQSANFRINLGDLPLGPSQVLKVELPTATAKVAAVGDHRQPVDLREVEFGPLRITISSSGIDGVLEWVQKLRDHGGVLESDRRHLTVEMLDAALAKTLGTIELEGCQLQAWEESKFEPSGAAIRTAVLTFSVQGFDLHSGAR